MKNVKKALLGTALAGALVVGGGYGTYSWFTAQVTASGEVQNTTLELNNGVVEAGSLFPEGKKLAPSRETGEKTITIVNTGEENMFVRGKIDFMVEKDNEPAKNLLKGYRVQPVLKYNGEVIADLGWVEIKDLQPLLDQWLPGKDGTGNNPADSGQFAAGDKFEIVLNVMLEKNAGNEYQGATLKGNFEFQGKQIDENAKFPNN
ncbi:hypothetical protein [Bacillus sp. 165]|uniref:hypothetical protein n=1 Tax=Bacillus sp. 165 TaxID=1529117 RepID=UPI001ADD4968|nr:hypothetical protein [Bacillus sp. 165]MBO9128496.1 hypothetical protein [Bacillus sp. 165]